MIDDVSEKNYNLLSNMKVLPFVVLVVVAFASCRKKWDKEVDVRVTSKATTDEILIAGKSFIMDSLLFGVESMELSGKRIQAKDIWLKPSQNQNVNFIHEKELVSSVGIPQGTYDQLKFYFDLGSSNVGSLFVSGNYYMNNGSIYRVRMSFDLNESIVGDVLDSDGGTTVLMEYKNNRTMELRFDPEILFSDITPGLWNAAAVTSLNGANTIVIDGLNNQSIYNSIINNFKHSFRIGMK